MARKGDQEVWIIRTSHPGDWFGMIDLLPSRLCTSGYVQPEIDRIMKELSDDFTTLCAQAEGWGDYSLDDITVTVKPCLE